MRVLALFPLFLLALACGSEPRYQLVPVGGGAVYRLDSKTGEVWRISGTASYRVLDPTATQKKLAAEARAREAAAKQAAQEEERRLKADPLGPLRRLATEQRRLGEAGDKNE